MWPCTPIHRFSVPSSEKKLLNLTETLHPELTGYLPPARPPLMHASDERCLPPLLPLSCPRVLPSRTSTPCTTPISTLIGHFPHFCPQLPADFTLKDFRTVYNAFISEVLSLVAEECDGGRTDALMAKVYTRGILDSQTVSWFELIGPEMCSDGRRGCYLPHPAAPAGGWAR